MPAFSLCSNLEGLQSLSLVKNTLNTGQQTKLLCAHVAYQGMLEASK